MIAVSLTWKLCTSAVDIRTCAEIKKIKIFFSPYLTEEQTISKWEVGDSTPDMEKLIAISDMFEISLDELVMDKVPTQIGENSFKSEIASELKEKVLTDENKKKAKKGLKIAAIIFGVIFLIDVISMIVYVSLYGFPQ